MKVRRGATYPRIQKNIRGATVEEACREADVVREAVSGTKAEMEELKPNLLDKRAALFSMGSFFVKE